jgi:hypothetical protein
VKLRYSQLSLPSRDVWLPARLAHAPDVRGLVLVWQAFANPAAYDLETPVADTLQRAGYATLALDLLSDEEGRDSDARYNVANLGARALAALEWLRHQPDLAALPLGVFAADTAAAAAIRAAAQLPGRIHAMSILSGRPDLSGAAPLHTLKTPTCFIVGKDDPRAPILRQVFELVTATRDWQTSAGGEPERMSAAMLAACADIAAAWMQVHLPVSVGNQNAAPGAPVVDTAFSPQPEK